MIRLNKEDLAGDPLFHVSVRMLGVVVAIPFTIGANVQPADGSQLLSCHTQAHVRVFIRDVDTLEVAQGLERGPFGLKGRPVNSVQIMGTVISVTTKRYRGDDIYRKDQDYGKHVHLGFGTWSICFVYNLVVPLSLVQQWSSY